MDAITKEMDVVQLSGLSSFSAVAIITEADSSITDVQTTITAVSGLLSFFSAAVVVAAVVAVAAETTAVSKFPVKKKGAESICFFFFIRKII